ncbi:DUF1731 domain-containing protein [Dysgonomonas sp. Marseille-P4677]|uniref:DUF1731 domain-containing protein n=1 Tax=Dysgonomonas sp. Marseille-P4677 TaxID=2364790 RepID=UPI0019144A5E|nr:DUF1731 domain-containing protein [Dysgonomonas sp. Marseille-P4677]MBK5720738.1 DUF1731 domain-containing protein [Dysgonomonas sp. Marseille-P4677]
MREIVLITGANGLVAGHTAKILKNNYDVRFLTRNPKQKNEYKWDPVNWEIDDKALDGVSYIIHLSGAKIYDGTPLTDERKKLIWDTRVGASELLLERIKSKNIRLKAFISASALGHYAFTDNTIAIDENGNIATTYEAELTVGWEKAADQFKIDGVVDRVVKLRICLVLGKEGSLFLGFKDKLKNDPDKFKNIEGGTYFPWVHADDMGGMFAYGVTNNTLDGVFNTTAPDTTSQEAIFKMMYYLDKQDITAFEKVDTSFTGKHLTSAKIEKTGFKFKYPDIKSALENLMK